MTRVSKKAPPKVPITCQACGKTKEVLRYKAPRTKYCSRACAGCSRKPRTTTACEFCAQLFESIEGSRARFCSRTCGAQGTQDQRTKSIRRFHHRHPERAKEVGRKGGATKQRRAQEDPAYRKQLVAQAHEIRAASITPEARRRRTKTIRDRYTPEEISAWCAKGGLGQTPWNKGLSKETDLRVAAQAQKLLGHPPSHGSGWGKCGKRSDLGGAFFRSTREANVARIFRFLETPSDYEPKVFEFHGGDQSVEGTYRPAFWLPESACWVEISGWSSPTKLQKLSRFHTEYPEERMFPLERQTYLALQKEFSSLIPHWKFSKGGKKTDADCLDFLDLLNVERVSA